MFSLCKLLINGNGSAFENNLDSGLLSPASLRDVQGQRSWNAVAPTARDCGTTARLKQYFIFRFSIVRRRGKARFDAHLNRLRMHACKAIGGSR